MFSKSLALRICCQIKQNPSADIVLSSDLLSAWKGVHLIFLLKQNFFLDTHRIEMVKAFWAYIMIIICSHNFLTKVQTTSDSVSFPNLCLGYTEYPFAFKLSSEHFEESSTLFNTKIEKWVPNSLNKLKTLPNPTRYVKNQNTCNRFLTKPSEKTASK